MGMNEEILIKSTDRSIDGKDSELLLQQPMANLIEDKILVSPLNQRYDG